MIFSHCILGNTKSNVIFTFRFLIQLVRLWVYFLKFTGCSSKNLRATNTYMIINLKAREINRDTHKLI